MPNPNGFNANEVDPNFAFEALPAGKCRVVITDSEMKPTKSGGGRHGQQQRAPVEALEPVS